MVPITSPLPLGEGQGEGATSPPTFRDDYRAVTMRQLVAYMEVASAIILRPDEADASSAALNTDARDTVDATGPVE